MSKALPIIEDDLRFECTGCGGCCTGAPGYVWLSHAEMQQIADFLGISLEAFQLKYTLYSKGKYSLIEKPDNSYDCIFLQGKSCSIYPVRPVQCKTFPFWPSIMQSKAAWDDCARSCEGISDSAPIVSKERILENLRKYQQTYDEAKMSVQEKKWQDVIKRYGELGIDIKKDLKEQAALGSGKGGQKAQKTHNAVTVTHMDSGLFASCHANRSYELNRFIALRSLLEKLEAKILGKKSKAELELEKKRKQKKRRKRRSKTGPIDDDKNTP